MARSRLMRSHSTDGLLHRTPSTWASDTGSYHHGSEAWDYPKDIYGYDSEFTRQYDGQYRQSSTWNGIKDNNFQRQPIKPRRVTWGSTPRYSLDRDRLANDMRNDRYGDSRCSELHGSYGSQSGSCCPIHGQSRQRQAMRSNLGRNDYDRSAYGSPSYPLNYHQYNSKFPSRNRSSSYYQSASNPLTELNLGTSTHYHTVPGRPSSFSYLRNPLLDYAYYPSYGSLSRDQVRSMLTSRSSSQRLGRPKWRRSVIGLNQLSLHD